MALPDLTDQFIDENYAGLLHTANEPLSGSTFRTVYDGLGNPTTISISNSGTKISDIAYPTSEPSGRSIMVGNGTQQLALSSWGDFWSSLGGEVDGTYTKPTITLTNGVIVNISNGVEEVRGGLQSFTTPGTFNFTVPAGVTKVKFIVTGGGGWAYTRQGGAGGTIIGYLTVTPSETIQVIVGAAGNISSSIASIGGTSSISNGGGIIATADGGNSSLIGTLQSGGGIASVGASTVNLLSHFVIKGGDGGHSAVGANDRESVGAASYWGSAAAYGGGQGTATGGPLDGAPPGNGVVIFEW